MEEKKNKRSYRLQIWLSEEELAQIKQKQDKKRLADYAREALLNAKAKQYKQYPPELLVAINRVGNNINQLAKRANSSRMGLDVLEKKVVLERLKEIDMYIQSLIHLDFGDDNVA